MLLDVLREAKTLWGRTCGSKRPKRETRQKPRESEKTLTKEIENRLETRRDADFHSGYPPDNDAPPAKHPTLAREASPAECPIGGLRPPTRHPTDTPAAPLVASRTTGAPYKLLATRPDRDDVDHAHSGGPRRTRDRLGRERERFETKKKQRDGQGGKKES